VRAREPRQFGIAARAEQLPGRASAQKAAAAEE
jgi:hypothetical protein